MKRYLIIILQIALLYGLSLIGIMIKNWLNIPIPGSIIGFFLLFLLLQFKIMPEKMIGQGANFILTYLPLFFVPSTVGVIQHPELLSLNGLMAIGLVIVSTFITIIVVGKVSERLSKTEEVR